MGRPVGSRRTSACTPNTRASVSRVSTSAGRRVGAQRAVRRAAGSDRSGAPRAPDRAARPAPPARASTVARSRSIAASWCAMSSPAIGSSSSSSGASCASARARCTRCRSPPDSSVSGRSASAVVSVAASARVTASTSAVVSACSRPRWGSRPSATASRTDSGTSAGASCGNSAAWRAICRRDSPASGVPASVTRPADGVCRPSSSRSSVDLPAPLGPHSADQLARADREADVADHRPAGRS